MPWEVTEIEEGLAQKMMMEMMARSDYQLFSIEKPDAAAKKRQAVRRSELVKWRDKVKRGK